MAEHSYDFLNELLSLGVFNEFYIYSSLTSISSKLSKIYCMNINCDNDVERIPSGIILDGIIGAIGSYIKMNNFKGNIYLCNRSYSLSINDVLSFIPVLPEYLKPIDNIEKDVKKLVERTNGCNSKVTLFT